MKYFISSFLFLTLTLNLVAQLPSCDGNRYKKNVFWEIDSSMNVQYGQNYTMNHVLQNLTMDIYQPWGDTVQKRPLIIFIHGGGFVSGSKEDNMYISMLFALKGFVTATINYRLIDVPLVDSVTVTEGMVQAVSDAKAAVRFFVEDAATADLYKTDTNYIFISGASAGGVTASTVAYLDPTDNIPPYILNLIAENGGFTGNSSNNTSHTTPIKGVINYCGALWRKEFISTGEPALTSFHDLRDTIVPCYHGASDAYPFPLYVDGSCAMHQEADMKGVYNDIFINDTNGHCAYFFEYPLADTVLQKSADFLYDIICNNILSVNPTETVETGVQLYPNPAGKEISIVFPVNLTGKEKIQIFSSTGKLLREIETDHTITLNISDLPGGLYFIHLQNQTERTLKFIKQ